MYRQEYIVEVIQQGYRVKKEKIPFDAFREAIANSLVNRTWDVRANTKAEFYNDHFIISSPGGLMEGMSKEQYLSGTFSMLPNPIIANIFFRLNIVELFATGINRINAAYKDSFIKPEFDVTDESITLQLPVIINNHLSLDEMH